MISCINCTVSVVWVLQPQMKHNASCLYSFQKSETEEAVYKKKQKTLTICCQIALKLHHPSFDHETYMNKLRINFLYTEALLSPSAAWADEVRWCCDCWPQTLMSVAPHSKWRWGGVMRICELSILNVFKIHWHKRNPNNWIVEKLLKFFCLVLMSHEWLKKKKVQR